MKKQKLKNTELREKDFIKSLCFLCPSFLGVCVFFIIPFGVVVYYSLIDGVASSEFVFLDNFKALLQNSSFRIAAKYTLTFFPQPHDGPRGLCGAYLAGAV